MFKNMYKNVHSNTIYSNTTKMETIIPFTQYYMDENKPTKTTNNSLDLSHKE